MTTADEYYDLIKDIGSGQLFYLTHKGDNEYVFEGLIINTSKRTESINRLKRAMMDPKFVAFPGTPEMNTFLEEDVADSEINP